MYIPPVAIPDYTAHDTLSFRGGIRLTGAPGQFHIQTELKCRRASSTKVVGPMALP